MIIECIKDVVMDGTNEVAFNAGKKYDAEINGNYIDAIDNQGDVHGIGELDDSWFHEYFKIVP